ncbi:unnamed protein product [Heligmosomoides polygyrus]|uniref:Uncharacterized protein n=1 Tax=Heligmosomoides polygyrus TaxID=6339 RepID=A0A183FT57_HELPZ|nr:unnamed protein product [Heligmosomoides polygyrus]
MAEDGAVTSSGRAWTRPLTYQIIKSATIHDRDTSGGDEPRFHTKHIRWRRRCRPPRSVESEQRHPEDSDASSGQGQINVNPLSKKDCSDHAHPSQAQEENAVESGCGTLQEAAFPNCAVPGCGVTDGKMDVIEHICKELATRYPPADYVSE